MNFKEAMIECVKGKKIRSKCWSDDTYVFFNEENKLVDKYNYEKWGISGIDEGWELYEDKNPEVKQYNVSDNMLLFTIGERISKLECIVEDLKCAIGMN